MNNLAQEFLFVSSNAPGWIVTDGSGPDHEFYNVKYICRKQKVSDCECPPMKTAAEALQLAYFDAQIVSKDTFLENLSK